MTWQETISFLTGCMPRPVARALMQQQEGSVREIRVRAGGKVRILTAGGEIACACTPTLSPLAACVLSGLTMNSCAEARVAVPTRQSEHIPASNTLKSMANSLF